MRLLLARHGQSVWNEVKKFQGSTDVELSALGRAQAAALGRALRGYRLAAAYVSPMHRALATAEIALGQSRSGTGVPGRSERGGVWGAMSGPPIVVTELRELCLGEWEGCTVDEIRSREGDPYARWVSAPLDCPPPGAEPLPDVCARVLRAIDRIVAAHRDGDDVLLVAHGGVISVYACWLLGVDFNRLWRLRVDNASLTVVKPPRLVSLNDTSHLTGDLAPGPLLRGKYVTESKARTNGAEASWPAAPPGRVAP
ncbi:MAG: histidine phosphatase family protein [Candidatus Rokubacteria bacterium]|nr:histidine phosphatase family protein [Candidatus Rokubacteria bacterium]